MQLGAKPQVPQTRQQLDGLIARRDELRQQLQNATSQRSGLAQHISALSKESPLRVEPLARLEATDARISQLETAIQQADDAIASAKGSLLSSEDPTVIHIPAVPRIPDIPSFVFDGSAQQQPWSERLVNSLETVGPITLATVVLIGAVMYWRISRSMKNQLNKLMGMQQARLDELQRSVDTVAVEIERVSENQRFVTKLVGDRPLERR
jgi:hypothetical protein